MTQLTIMQVVYMIAFIGLITLFIAILFYKVDKAQQKSLKDDLLDSSTPTTLWKPKYQRTAYPDGTVKDANGNDVIV